MRCSRAHGSHALTGPHAKRSSNQRVRRQALNLSLPDWRSTPSTLKIRNCTHTLLSWPGLVDGGTLGSISDFSPRSFSRKAFMAEAFCCAPAEPMPSSIATARRKTMAWSEMTEVQKPRTCWLHKMVKRGEWHLDLSGQPIGVAARGAAMEWAPTPPLSSHPLAAMLWQPSLSSRL